MKVRTVSLLVVSTAIGIGAVHHALKTKSQTPPPETLPCQEQSPAHRIEQSKSKTHAADAVTTSKQKTPPPIQKKTQGKLNDPAGSIRSAPEKQINRKPSAEQQRAAHLQYWNRAKERFNRQRDRLSAEHDFEKRSRLIRTIAQHVRMDTLGTIEWAMGMDDSEERRLALEAINEYALTGIGARVAIDETGFPKITETTVLSAVDSTGMVESGDYIVGMEDENGNFVSFEGMGIHQIVRNLRGEAGTDVLLLMERTAHQDGGAIQFEVPVQRSLLVIQPPN